MAFLGKGGGAHGFVMGVVLVLAAHAGYAEAATREEAEPAEVPEPPPATPEQREKSPAPSDEPVRISLEDATAIVRQAYGGRVVSSSRTPARPASARPKESGYRVRVDIDGRVKTVFVDDRGRIHEDPEF